MATATVEQPVSKVACPECRHEFFISDSGVDGLKKNFIGNRSELRQKTRRMCEVCPGPKKKTSFMFCLQCGQSYCKSCSDYHSTKKTSYSHELVRLDELLSDDDFRKKDQPIFCDRHSELCYSEDKVAVCTMCGVLDYRTHHCEEIQKVVVELRAEGNRNLEEVQTAVTKVDSNMEMFKVRKRRLSDQIKNVKTKISEEADKCIKLIKTEKQNLFEELHKIESHRKHEIEEWTAKLYTRKVQLTRLTNFYSELMLKGADIDICREEQNLHIITGELVNLKRFEGVLKELDVTNIVLLPSKVTCDSSLLGLLKTGMPTLAHSVLDGDNLVTALALMNEELFVTRREVKYVFVYDSTTLQLKRSILVRRLGTQPFGLAACPITKLLFVSDFDNHAVHKVDLSTESICSWKVVKRPIGLSVTSKQNVLVTSQPSPSTGYVREYTQRGTLIRKVSCKTALWQAAETGHGTLIVSHSSPSRLHGIAELSWSGEVLHCYGTHEYGKGQMKKPRALVLNSNGDVLVADKTNSRIQILDSTLTTAHSLQLPSGIELRRPLAVCYDESRGRLFVGEYSCKKRSLLVFDNVTCFRPALSGKPLKQEMDH